MGDTTAATLYDAYQVASTYNGNLTLRQLYYRLVAAAQIPNSQQAYKRLGKILADARLAGTFPLDWLIDRGRTVHPANSADDRTSVGAAWANAQDAIYSFPYWYIDRGRWFNQPTQVSVWVEKQALEGVFEGPCRSQGVGHFACKGYPSVSSLYEWMKQARAIEDAMPGAVQEHRILYFGDHDPDGWQIPRSAHDTLNQLTSTMGAASPAEPIRLERIALNMSQIRTFNPPPFPAKMSSSRYQGYVQEHGTTDAWELDALAPPTLDALIVDNIFRYFDEDIYDANRTLIRARREELRTQMRNNPNALMERL